MFMIFFQQMTVNVVMLYFVHIEQKSKQVQAGILFSSDPKVDSEMGSKFGTTLSLDKDLLSFLT